MATFQTRDGTNLYVKDWGTTGPVVILIHGWPLSADMWDYQAVPLAEAGCRVIAYDRRGFGRSDQPWSGYGYDTLADDLKDLIDWLDVDDVTLVGFSMGGGEVARYVGKYGAGRVKKAVFVSAVVPFMLQTADNPEGVDGDIFEDMKDGLREDRAAFLADFALDFYGVSDEDEAVSDEVLMWTNTVAMMASAKATLDCVDAFSKTDFREDLKGFEIETLLIHGTDDKTVPTEASAHRAVELLPNATLKEYDGAPHGLFMTHKDDLTEDLLDFIRG